jgi:hypothetical protein
MNIDTTDWDSMTQGEQKAWRELKGTLDSIPAEGLYTFFHGIATDRDQLMDDLGNARESWWLLGVLSIEES